MPSSPGVAVAEVSFNYLTPVSSPSSEADWIARSHISPISDGVEGSLVKFNENMARGRTFRPYGRCEAVIKGVRVERPLRH